jgi:hypothetical protein
MSRNRTKRQASSSRNEPRSAEHFKQQYAGELRTLAEILKYKFSAYCPTSNPLYEAAKSCERSEGDSYKYTLQPMLFRLDSDSLHRTLPKKVADVSLELTLTIHGHCNLNNEINDPFSEFLLELILNGRRQETQQALKSAWHLDKDEPVPSGQEPEFVHPCYHFQYGGRKMWDGAGEPDYGEALILETPRLAHPPMDAILAIDFILVNYYPRSNTTFRDEENYQQLLRSAQKRVWKPYAQALAALWDTGSPSTNPWPAAKIWPQLAAL